MIPNTQWYFGGSVQNYFKNTFLSCAASGCKSACLYNRIKLEKTIYIVRTIHNMTTSLSLIQNVSLANIATQYFYSILSSVSEDLMKREMVFFKDKLPLITTITLIITFVSRREFTHQPWWLWTEWTYGCEPNKAFGRVPTLPSFAVNVTEMRCSKQTNFGSRTWKGRRNNNTDIEYVELACTVIF